MPSNKQNKNIATVRVWKRQDRRGRWYCTARLPARVVTRSCRTDHRASAEEVAALLLSDLMRGKRRTEIATAVQLEFPPPSATRAEDRAETAHKRL